jgi:hypothetical protein
MAIDNAPVAAVEPKLDIGSDNDIEVIEEEEKKVDTNEQ